MRSALGPGPSAFYAATLSVLITTQSSELSLFPFYSQGHQDTEGQQNLHDMTSVARVCMRVGWAWGLGFKPPTQPHRV